MADEWKERVAGTYYAPPPPRPLRAGDWLKPVREPGNIHDPNAISLQLRGEHVGYVSRDSAKLLAPALDAGHGLFAEVVETGPRGRIFVEYKGPAADHAEAMDRDRRRTARAARRFF